MKSNKARANWICPECGGGYAALVFDQKSEMIPVRDVQAGDGKKYTIYKVRLWYNMVICEIIQTNFIVNKIIVHLINKVRLCNNELYRYIY